MFRNLYVVVTFFALVMMSGCTSTPGYFFVNNNRFDSPEALGKAGKIEVAGSIQGESVIVVDTNPSQDPPGSAGGIVVDDDGIGDIFEDVDDLVFLDNLYLDLRLGLGERFDISFDLPRGDLPSIVKVKYQFLGKTQIEAKNGNIAGAVVLGFAYGSRDIDNEEDFFGNIFDGELSYYGLTSSIIFGKRVTDRLLLYFNQTVSLYYADLDMDRDLTIGGPSPYQYSSEGHQLLSLIGGKLFFNERQSFFLGLEGGLVSLDWDNADSNSEFAVGFMTGMAF